MNRISILLTLVALLTLEVNAQSLKERIKNISGKYVGEWTVYKYLDGEIVKSVSWKDTLISSNPVIKESIAYLTINSTMTFDNPHIPKYSMMFKEGYELSSGGNISHFFEVNGVKSYEYKISDNTFIVSQPITQNELSQLGFSNVKEAYNTIVKIRLSINGKEVHQNTRISTIILQNQGKEEIIQFESLKGYHQKVE
jgi:hypothetical protein